MSTKNINRNRLVGIIKIHKKENAVNGIKDKAKTFHHTGVIILYRTK